MFSFCYAHVSGAYLSVDVDLELLVESVKFARKVANMEAFKDVVRDEYEPGKDCASDEQIQGRFTFYPPSTSTLMDVGCGIGYIKKALSSTWCDAFSGTSVFN